MTPTDIAIRLQVLVERYKSSQSKVILRTTRVFEDFIISATGREELHEMSPWQVSRFLTQLASQQDFSNVKMLDYIQELHNFAEAYSEIEADAWGVDPLSAQNLERAFNSPLSIDTMDRGKDVTTYLTDWWSGVEKHIFGSIRRSAYEGRSNSAIRNELRGTKSQNYNDGLLSRIRRNAVTTNSVAIQHLSSVIRNMVASSAGASAILWNAMFEKSVCQRCQGLDSQPFQIARGPRSPLHPGCHCIMVPIFKDTTITPARQTYFDWLREQDFEFIVDALGQTRAQVFVDGGLSPARFRELLLDKKFEPLTLEEFRARAPSAFKRAGV